MRYLVPGTQIADPECPIDAHCFASRFIPEEDRKSARRGLMTLAAPLLLSDQVINANRDAGWAPLATLAAAVLLVGLALWWLRRRVRGYRNEPS
ncbi:MAG: hypothetical protein PVJ17_06490 [Lysobacterales bacterium]